MNNKKKLFNIFLFTFSIIFIMNSKNAKLNILIGSIYFLYSILFAIFEIKKEGIKQNIPFIVYIFLSIIFLIIKKIG